jgi:hypothetical protein
MGFLLLLEVALDFGGIQVMLVLQEYGMQELKGHGDIYSDFKGRPRRPGNMWYG